MLAWLLCLATASVGLGVTQPQEDNAADARSACGVELIWPPSDSIILYATDSRETQVYFKLVGDDCSEFMSTSPTAPARQGPLLGILFQNTETSRNSASFQQIVADPLDTDPTPVRIRLMRSPLLAKNGNVSCPRDTNALDGSKNFSVWTFALVQMTKNSKGLHDLESPYAVLEIHLISNTNTALVNIPPASSSLLNFRLFGRPSSHFSLVTPRYTSIPGYVCMSACGTMCEGSSLFRHSLLLTTHSPVCTRSIQAVNLTLRGPPFTLHGDTHGLTSTPHHAVVNPNVCGRSDSCSSVVAFVTIGGDTSSARAHGVGLSISATGPGRHRLLSVIASVLNDTVGFVFLATRHSRVDSARVHKFIRQYDLASSYAFIAFRKRKFGATQGVRVGHPHDEFHPSDDESPLSGADFGSIHDGILLSRAAALVILMAWRDEMEQHVDDTLPAACTEHLIFSDAWLGWCAAELEIPALDFRFSAGKSDDASSSTRDCAATSPLYGKLVHLYEQQRLSDSRSMHSPFSERTTLGFQYFMQTLVFHLVTSPRILKFLDDEERGDNFFWDVCCSRLLTDYMMSPLSLSAHADLHPLLQLKWDALASASNRSAFLSVLRATVMAGGAPGRETVASSVPSARRRLRMSVSAVRVLGCSVQYSDTFRLDDVDLLRGTTENHCS
jgi:hypothetical protein